MHQSGTGEESGEGGVDVDELAEQHAEAVARYDAGRYKDAASLFERTLARCRADWCRRLQTAVSDPLQALGVRAGS